MALADEYCTRNLGAVEVAPLDAMVTPEPCAKDTCPAPIAMMFNWLPIGYATDEFGGIV